MGKKKHNGGHNANNGTTFDVLTEINKTMKEMGNHKELSLPAGIEITLRNSDGSRADLLLKKGNQPFSNLSVTIDPSNKEKTLRQACREIVEAAHGKSAIRYTKRKRYEQRHGL